jgi:4-diphosphocytidyl-2-C-methyl-D-erythritol kinase
VNDGPIPALRALAPAKINLGLFLGPTRADGRHELATVMQSISLADELELGPGLEGADVDVVECAGVDGPNLAAEALAQFRAETDWQVAPLRLTIVKRVPVAAGLGGGSGDAAATLRLAGAASGHQDPQLLGAIATRLGADVPAQLTPGRWLAGGAGEILEALPDPTPSFGILVLPLEGGLSTATVFAEADRLKLAREHRDLEQHRSGLRNALAFGSAMPPLALLANDLQPAAISLRHDISRALDQARDAGADEVMLSGSGPTVIGLFWRANFPARLERALAGLAGRVPAAIIATPVGAQVGLPAPSD